MKRQPLLYLLRNIFYAFPEKIREHAQTSVFGGGEFLLEKMNFPEKAIVKNVADYINNQLKYH